MAIAAAQFTIRDTNDITVSNTAPASPVTDELWLDTSTQPSVLRRWDGTKWVEASGTLSPNRNLLVDTDKMRYIDTTGGNADYTLRECPLSEYGYNIVLDDADNNKGLQYSVSYDWRLEWIGEGAPVPITNGGHGVTVQFCRHVIWADNDYPYERPWVYFENETMDGVAVGKQEQSGHWQGTFQLNSEHISSIQNTAASKKDEKGIRCRVYYVPTGYRFYAYNFKMEQSAYPTPYYIAPEETDLWQYTGRNLLIGSQNFTNAQWKLSHAVRSVIVEPGLMCLRPTGSAAYARYRLNTQTYGDTYYPDNMYTVSYEARVCETVESLTAPETPELNKIWKDTSTDPATLKWWNQSTSTWVDCTEYTIQIPQTYLGYMTKAMYDADASTFGKSADTYGSFVPVYQGDGWHRYQETFVLRAHLFSAVQEQLDDALLTIQLGMSASKLPVEIRNVKLERGNKASAWSPAPEDAGIYTDAAAQDAKTYADGVAQDAADAAAQDAKNYADGAAQTAAQDAVDGLEIGGRNLILSSGEEEQIVGGQVADNRELTTEGLNLTKNNTESEFAFQYNWELTYTGTGTADAIPSTANMSIRFGGNSGFAQVTPNEWAKFDPSKTDQSGSCKYIFKLSAAQAAAENPKIGISVNDVPSGYTLTWSKLKLEQGNKHTTWTAAPDDADRALQEQIKKLDEQSRQLVGLQDSYSKAEMRISEAEGSIETLSAQYNTFSNGLEVVQSSQTQLADSIKWAVDRKTEIEGVVDNTQAWMRFETDDNNKPVLRIGRTDSTEDAKFATELSNSQLSFLQDGSVVAYINSGMLNIQIAQILSSMVLGKFTMTVADDGETIVYS